MKAKKNPVLSGFFAMKNYRDGFFSFLTLGFSQIISKVSFSISGSADK